MRCDTSILRGRPACGSGDCITHVQCEIQEIFASYGVIRRSAREVSGRGACEPQISLCYRIRIWSKATRWYTMVLYDTRATLLLIYELSWIAGFAFALAAYPLMY